MKRSTLEKILSTFNSSSRDETRRYLQQVFITQREDNLDDSFSYHIAACDGYILTKFDVTHDADNLKLIFQHCKREDKDFIAIENTKQNIDSIKLILKTYKGSDEIQFQIIPLNDKRIALNYLGISILLSDTESINMPRLDSVIPHKPEIVKTIAFNYKYLIDLAKSLELQNSSSDPSKKFAKQSNEIVYFHLMDNPLSPIMVETQMTRTHLGKFEESNSQVISLLMPCKTDIELNNQEEN